jgi:hypothetical protein
VSGGHCPKCWSGEPVVPGGLCRCCYAWYQDWLYRRLPEQKASYEEWKASRPPAPPSPAPRPRRPGCREVVPPLTPLFFFGGRTDPGWRTDPGNSWDNAVRIFEDVTGEDVT